MASDGTGDFLTISEAVVKVPESENSKFVIHVKGGLYRENVILPPKKSNVVMFGDGNTKNIVSAGLNRLDNPLFTTFQTATICKSTANFCVSSFDPLIPVFRFGSKSLKFVFTLVLVHYILK